MHKLLTFIALFSVLATVVPEAAAQADRRSAFMTPGLQLNTNGPTAATRAMAFINVRENNRNQEYFLAAGEDKVVRIWPVQAGNVNKDGLKTLRWHTWKEWRGAIYAMAISTDRDHRYIAIAGYGGYTGAVAILDRTTGKVAYGFQPPRNLKDHGYITTSLAFAPNGTKELAIGKDNGTVWVWKFAQNRNNLLRVGNHGARETINAYGKKAMSEVNRVGCLIYLNKDQLLSIAQDRKMKVWATDRQNGRAKQTWSITVPMAYRFAVTSDKQWVAIAGRDHSDANVIKMYRTSGRGARSLALPDGAIASAMAVSPNGKQLAVAVELPRSPKTSYYKPKPYQVWICDATGATIRATKKFRASFSIESLSFDSGGQHLAFAGGEDFSIRLYNLTTQKITSRLASPGNAIWDVAFSKDGKELGYRAGRNTRPTNHNDWGSGAWKVFNISNMTFSKNPENFRPVAAINAMEGWSMRIRHPRAWQVVDPRGRAWPLELDPDRHGLPTCYTFFKPLRQRLRLAVGHKWGISIFALGRSGAELVRVAHGHAGEVTAVAPSQDHSLLVTASRDQTISCFSTRLRKYGTELGASCQIIGTRLMVKGVDKLSAAWEAGLAEDDEIVKMIIDSGNGFSTLNNSKSKWKAYLQKPKPFREIYVEVKRRGINKLLRMKTTVRDRPLWRFFPMNDGEWVMWRWRDHYYHCSTNGDFVVGWQINTRAVADTPEFFKAEQFRKQRHRPDKFKNLLDTARGDSIIDLLPPKIDLLVSQTTTDGKPVQAKVKVTPRSSELSRQPRSISLCVNDHKKAAWVAQIPSTRTITLGEESLRPGEDNILIAKAYSEKRQARADSDQKVVRHTGPKKRGRLHGIFIGISDYELSPVVNKTVWPSLLFPVKDAEEMYQVWSQQANGNRAFYRPGRMVLLRDHKVSKARVLNELRQILRIARPEDRVILFMAGHGWSSDFDYVSRKDLDAFAFVLPRFHLKKFEKTGLTSETLYENIITIPSNKLVLIDACYSGSAQGASFVRGLTPEGHGPPILCAADRNEEAWEHPKVGHGLFTRVIIDALTEDVDSADRNRDQQISVNELNSYLKVQVPLLLSRLKVFLEKDAQSAQQNPQIFPKVGSKLYNLDQPLARRQ